MLAATLRRLLFPSDPGARKRRDRVLAILFALFCLVLVLRAARKEVGVIVHNQEWGARFLARQDPYFDPAEGRRIHGPYPPSLALVAAPLALLPTLIARILWSAAQVGALLVCFRLVRRRIARHWPALLSHASAVYALGLLLASRYLLRDTAGGGGNLMYSSLVWLGIELALVGRETLAGLPLAFSLVLKPNLWPLLLFLALRSRWRALASALGAAALFFALPGLYFGPRAYADLSVHWAGDVLRYEEREDLHASALVPDGMPPARWGMNQSLREAVHRILRPPGDSGAADVHFVEVPPAVANGVARALSLFLLLCACWCARRARGERAEWLVALAFFPLALLLSPITWKAHHVDLLLCLSGLVALAASERRTGRWLGPVLCAYWIVCDLFSEEIVGSSLRDYLQALSVVTWADIGLFFILLRLAARPPAPAEV